MCTSEGLPCIRTDFSHENEQQVNLFVLQQPSLQNLQPLLYHKEIPHGPSPWSHPPTSPPLSSSSLAVPSQPPPRPKGSQLNGCVGTSPGSAKQKNAMASTTPTAGKGCPCQSVCNSYTGSCFTEKRYGIAHKDTEFGWCGDGPWNGCYCSTFI
jgi:hypothetical protein